MSIQLNIRWLYRAAEGRSKLQEMQREITTLRRTAARKHSEQEKLRDQVFTAELQRDAALVKFHSEGQSLIRRIQELEAKQKISEAEGAGGTRVSKVLYIVTPQKKICIVTLHSKCTRALTFEIFCQLWKLRHACLEARHERQSIQRLLLTLHAKDSYAGSHTCALCQ
jgi:hypothetical protein